ncbi:hypothetical protein BpHYR1_037547 [Brachionus plicatilis]|uniref:Uncharacterized protein n=1 Tax=Brachionus plicatilis TaxID=10195 RepID=A0A3M7RZV6_BRAPC|nr:hypothetical protein BpHYR1_037547 [Brachionus plicatilis]
MNKILFKFQITFFRIFHLVLANLKSVTMFSLKTICFFAIILVQYANAFSNCSYFPNFPDTSQQSFTRCDFFCCSNAKTAEQACCSNTWIIAPIIGGIIVLGIIICIISIILCLCKVACGCLECFICPCCASYLYTYLSLKKINIKMHNAEVLVSLDHFEHQKLIINFNLPEPMVPKIANLLKIKTYLTCREFYALSEYIYFFMLDADRAEKQLAKINGPKSDRIIRSRFWKILARLLSACSDTNTNFNETKNLIRNATRRNIFFLIFTKLFYCS